MDPLPVTFDTKVEREAFYRKKLATAPKWALRALDIIGSFQTQEEQTRERTIEHNGRGFGGFDGDVLTSYYAQMKRWEQSAPAMRRYPTPLSERQMQTLFKLIPKYTGQLLNYLDANGKAIPVVHHRRNRAI